jgi:hypothetical protein
MQTSRVHSCAVAHLASFSVLRCSGVPYYCYGYYTLPILLLLIVQFGVPANATAATDTKATRITVLPTQHCFDFGPVTAVLVLPCRQQLARSET